MTDSTGIPITGPTVTVSVLSAALAGIDGDTHVVVQIADNPELWRVSEITLWSMHEFHNVDGTVITLPGESVIIVTDKVIRCMPGVTNVPADEDAGAAPDAAPPHGLLRRILFRCRHFRKPAS